MKNKTSLILTIVLGLCVVLFAGYKCSRLDYNTNTNTTQTISCGDMPDMFALQEQIKTMQKLLNEKYPENPIKVDGLLGQKTYDKWGKWYCDESARITFERN
jgi:hypothetical protein